MRKKELLARGLAPLLQGGLLHGISRRGRGPRVLALVYHRVYDDPQGRLWSDPELHSADSGRFREQMTLLARHFHPITLDELPAVVDGSLCPKLMPVLVTFDDGYWDNHDIVLPILDEVGVRASFFITTGNLGSEQVYWFDYLYMICRFLPAGTHELPGLDSVQTLEAPQQRHSVALEWIEHCFRLSATEVDAIVAEATERHDAVIPDEARRFNRPMTLQQVRALSEAGMGIGAHSVTHPLIRQCDRPRRRQELMQSRDTLEQLLNRQVKHFAYPVGNELAIPEDSESLRQETGFDYLYSYEPGVIDAESPRARLPRLAVERGHSRAWMRAMLALPEVFHD